MPSRADLAKIHIAKKELGLDDQAYRDILYLRCRKRSAADLTPLQAAQLLDHFRSLGWKPRRRKKDAQMGLILRLWSELAAAGAVRSKSRHALESFARNVTGIDRLAWCGVKEKAKVIEALKAWKQRVGV